MHLTCFFGSPLFQLSRWLMIASTGDGGLPVCRSPMISWRWPRPIAVMASTAFEPVSIGSLDRLALDDGGGPALEEAALADSIGALAVDRVAERVRRRGEVAVTDGHREDLAGTADLAALLDVAALAEQHDAELTLLEVQRDTADAARELEQLVGHGLLQTLDAAMPSPVSVTRPISSRPVSGEKSSRTRAVQRGCHRVDGQLGHL